MDETSRILRFLEEETIFANVRKDALTKFASLGRVVGLSRGSRLFRAGQPGETLYFVMDGQVAVTLLSEDGRERILHLAGHGDMVGAVAFFDGRDYPCNVSAAEDSHLVAFSRSSVLGLLHRDAELTLALLGGLVARQRKIVEHLEQLSFEDTSVRLWRFLMEHSAGDGDSFPRLIDPLPTRDLIARAIGTVREVVSRRLSHLVKAGHVRVEGRRLTLISPPDSHSTFNV